MVSVTCIPRLHKCIRCIRTLLIERAVDQGPIGGWLCWIRHDKKTNAQGWFQKAVRARSCPQNPRRFFFAAASFFLVCFNINSGLNRLGSRVVPAQVVHRRCAHDSVKHHIRRVAPHRTPPLVDVRVRTKMTLAVLCHTLEPLGDKPVRG